MNTYLALDFGIKKMGMAMGNDLTRLARPFDILVMNNGKPDWDVLCGMIDAWEVTHVLVGLPLNADGTHSMTTQRAHKFARRLSHTLKSQKNAACVYVQNEHLTSVMARTLAREYGRASTDKIDDLAAVVLLQSYFDAPNQAVALQDYTPRPFVASCK